MRLPSPLFRPALYAIALLANGACATASEKPREANAADVVTAAGMTAYELAHTSNEESVLGCGLRVVGSRAEFTLCTAEDDCGPRRREIDAKDVVAVKPLGRVRPTLPDGSLGEEVDVASITLARSVGTSRGGVTVDPSRGLVTGGRQQPRPGITVDPKRGVMQSGTEPR